MIKGKYIRGTIFTAKDFEFDEHENKSVCLSQPIDNRTFWQKYLPLFAIIVITAVVYSFSFGNSPTNWDDDKYIDDNPLLKDFNMATWKKCFLSEDDNERYFMGNYHPLTMLTLNIDYHYSQLFPNGKAKPERFIAVNILLHIMSVCLVYIIMNQLFRKNIYSIVVALLFAVHTLHVESVTWIAERKDVLYTMFYFLSLLMYVFYKQKQKISFYFAALIVFLLSCFSKGQAVSLTLTLFIVDYLIYCQNLNGNDGFSFQIIDFLKPKNHLDKIPFLVLSLIFGLISIEAQKASTALQETDQYELYKRIAFGSYGFVQYILRSILPLKLSCLYPYPDLINKSVPWFCWFCIPIFIGLVLVNIVTYKRNSIITFGLMFYIANIALLLQFIPVGSAMFADRYSYIATLGLYVLLAYLLDYLISKRNTPKPLVYTAFGIYSFVLCVMTVNREKVWNNSESLWTDCTSKYPEAVIGWNNLGSYRNALADSLYKNDIKTYIDLKKNAIDCFTNGIKYKPDYVHAFYNRGLAKKDIFEKNKDTAYLNGAFGDYCMAIMYDLKFAPAFQNRALIYDTRGESFLDTNRDSANYYFAKAISDFDRAIELKPNQKDVYINRSASYGKSGNYEKALENLDIYINFDTSNAMAYSNRGLAYNGLKRYDEAIKDFNRAIALDSSMESAYYNRSITHRILENYQAAVDDLTKVVELNPNNSQAYYYRGLYLMVEGRKNDACEDFYKSKNLNFKPAETQIAKYCSSNK